MLKRGCHLHGGTASLVRATDYDQQANPAQRVMHRGIGTEVDDDRQAAPARLRRRFFLQGAQRRERDQSLRRFRLTRRQQRQSLLAQVSHRAAVHGCIGKSMPSPRSVYTGRRRSIPYAQMLQVSHSHRMWTLVIQISHCAGCCPVEATLAFAVHVSIMRYSLMLQFDLWASCHWHVGAQGKPRLNMPSPGFVPLRATPEEAPQAGQQPGSENNIVAETAEQAHQRRGLELYLITRERPHELQPWMDLAELEASRSGCPESLLCSMLIRPAETCLLPCAGVTATNSAASTR